MELTLPQKLRDHYLWIKNHSASEAQPGIALEIRGTDRIGLMADISSAISGCSANISYIQSWMEWNGNILILAQIEDCPGLQKIVDVLRTVPSVESVIIRPTLSNTYGKRVIIAGGGAQVAQVASGAIAEADRHNIRGEIISVDTIAVVGEKEIAAVVRGVGRLHRAGIFVLAGALMGGDIAEAILELRSNYGIPVITLKMAGSVNRVSDLVVTDPLTAGVMAVMLISHVGKFNLLQVHGREF